MGTSEPKFCSRVSNAYSGRFGTSRDLLTRMDLQHRFGEKPLFYGVKDGELIVELKASETPH